jgi:hypothetical protein
MFDCAEFVNLNNKRVKESARIGQLRLRQRGSSTIWATGFRKRPCSRVDFVGVVRVMTDTIAPAKAISVLQMLAQVEQWMAAIREIDREERTEMESASVRLEHLLAPGTE